MKNPEKYECRSLRVKISESGRFYTPAWERTGNRRFPEFHRLCGRVGRYEMARRKRTNNDLQNRDIKLKIE
jgi:hypothetical protein